MSTNLYELLPHPNVGRWLERKPLPEDDNIMVGSGSGWIFCGQTIKSIFDIATGIAADEAKGNVNPVTASNHGSTPEDWARGITFLRYAWKTKDKVKSNVAPEKRFTRNHRSNRSVNARRQGISDKDEETVKNENDAPIKQWDTDKRTQILCSRSEMVSSLCPQEPVDRDYVGELNHC
ncbi:MAG: hypothetical protein Q9209_005052 [Squamulea sp. 1 TL-2023]